MSNKRLTDKQAITAYMETMGTCPSCKEDLYMNGNSFNVGIMYENHKHITCMNCGTEETTYHCYICNRKYNQIGTIITSGSKRKDTGTESLHLATEQVRKWLKYQRTVRRRKFIHSSRHKRQCENFSIAD